FFPDKNEQTKIATFLSLIDERITTQSKIINDLKTLKTATAKKIFSQELRFKDDNGNDFPEWEEDCLENVCDIKKGEQFNKEDLNEIGLYPCLNGGISPSGFSEKYNTDENTITISEGGNSCGFVNIMKTKFWLGGHCYKILLFKKISLMYFYQLLKFNEQNVMNLRVGSGLPNIQMKSLKRFTIKISTSESEQNKIANFLSAIDSKIDIESQLLQKLEEQKKFLLQNMFV
ncbi:restriction endonuclease subunit S, partial [Chryseobacterium echinoideorum]|uniref:restriction endonuclease subunit S n=1 Tax=Chryseobacterium echinoideorum TaxID=1549648 RepID=UPI00162474D7